MSPLLGERRGPLWHHKGLLVGSPMSRALRIFVGFVLLGALFCASTDARSWIAVATGCADQHDWAALAGGQDVGEDAADDDLDLEDLSPWRPVPAPPRVSTVQLPDKWTIAPHHENEHRWVCERPPTV